MKPRTFPHSPALTRTLAVWRTVPFTLLLLTLTIARPTRSQEGPPLSESLAQAARNARENKPSARKPSRMFTNDDLAPQLSSSDGSEIPPESSAKQAPETSQQPAACNNPDDQRLKTELQADEEELAELRRDLSYAPKVISDNDVDLTNFKTGSSGLAVGSPPHPQSEPISPARVEEVILEEKIASLKNASRIACQSPEDARIQRELDSAKEALSWLQREFALDQTAYYSKTNFAEDSAGKAKLDAEQQQIESLQSEIKRLSDQLSLPPSNQVAQ